MIASPTISASAMHWRGNAKHWFVRADSSQANRRCISDCEARPASDASRQHRKAALLAAVLLCAIIFASSSYAVVDLLTPLNGTASSNGTVAFEYYASMQNLSGCTVMINGNAFPDQHSQSNTINHIEVQGIQPGQYVWNVTCAGGVAETSATRSFAVDTQQPTLAVVSPANGVQKAIALDIIPNDDFSPTLQCNASWNNQLLESFQVARNTHYAKSYPGTPGNGTLSIACADQAGNTMSQQRNLTIVPEFGLFLTLDKSQYGLGEPARLTIDTVSGANVSIDACPDQQGFVQCTSALLTSNVFPQTITLPYMNKTGSYVIEGMASFAGQSKLNQTKYSVANTMAVNVMRSQLPRLNGTVTLTASIGGGIGPYRISWRLHNGTIIPDASIVNVYFPTAGAFNESVTAYDSQNNIATANITLTVNPVYTVGVNTVDNKTGAQINGVDVDFDGLKMKTVQGYAYFDVEPGIYRVFASAPGYQYTMDEYFVNSSRTILLRMGSTADALPLVTLLSPGQNSAVASPVSIRYTASYSQPVTCTLYFGTGGAWFKPNGSMSVTDSGAKEFQRELPAGQYQARIECADGASQTVGFSVAATGSQQTADAAGPAAGAAANAAANAAPAAADSAAGTAAATGSTAPSEDEVKLQTTMETLEKILQSLDGYGPKEKEVIATVGFDKNIRNTKRVVQQAVRDINDLQYRKELDDAGKQAEHKRIIDSVNAQLANTPIGLTVVDTKSFVRYVKEDDMDSVTASLAGLGGLDSDPKRLAKRILPDQQKITVSTKVSQVDYLYPDKTTKSITVVARSLTYAPNIDSDYKVYEIIPKEVAKSARELTMLTKAEVLKDDPVLRYSTEGSIVYIIPKRVDATRVEDIKTVLAKPYAEFGSSATGFAIFNGNLLSGDLFGVSMPLVILIALIIVAYLAYVLRLGQKLKFIMYRLGRKEKVHYVRVLINDAIANLEGNNYEKADMLYKEIRLTYDALSTPEQNDLYEDVTDLVKRMDEYYFSIVMIELDAHLKANDMDAAIHSYEKLTGTYARLDAEHQQQLVTAVTAMARRIGLEVHA